MSTYILALIWSLSCVICLIIAKRSNVKKTALKAIAVTLLGPFAVPLVIAAKPRGLPSD